MPDAGDKFDKAETVDSGVYLGSLHWRFDPEDFYSVMVQKGKVIDVQMIPQNPNGYYPNYDLCLYGPDTEPCDNSCPGGIMLEHINFTQIQREYGTSK